MPKKRAFVRYSKKGKIVPGSLILTSGSYPSGPSTWSEVPADLCCDSCICYTITSVITGAAQYYDCNNVLQTTAELTPSQSVKVCATRVVASDNYSAVPGEPCIATYSCPTTTTSTTTTTTTANPVSDVRLKENIVATGGTVGQFNEYNWDWNETAKSLGLDHYPTTGVLAQEVLEIMPNAVQFDETIGYYRVNYNMIHNG